MNTSENRTHCPYFLQDLKACGLHFDGIYLPPRAHVLTYCLTALYRNCTIYERYCLSEKLHTVKSEQLPAGRRRYMRIMRERKVRIRACDPLGIPTGDFEEKARTIDYSQGGMRIVLESELPESSLMLFDFGDDFLIPGLQGIAELCWHRQHPDAPDFVEAGLAFRDHFSQAVLSVELQ
ncbi:MAG: PilZ domain-containing protein [Desulfobacterales bacterium]